MKYAIMMAAWLILSRSNNVAKRLEQRGINDMRLVHKIQQEPRAQGRGHDKFAEKPSLVASILSQTLGGV